MRGAEAGGGPGAGCGGARRGAALAGDQRGAAGAGPPARAGCAGDGAGPQKAAGGAEPPLSPGRGCARATRVLAPVRVACARFTRLRLCRTDGAKPARIQRAHKERSASCIGSSSAPVQTERPCARAPTLALPRSAPRARAQTLHLAPATPAAAAAAAGAAAREHEPHRRCCCRRRLAPRGLRHGDGAPCVRPPRGGRARLAARRVRH